MSKKSDPKMIFGAGFHAGVKAANARAETMSMTAAHLKNLADQQTGIAKKIYELVPINEAFDANRIYSELKRAGSAPDIKIVRGCLNTLKETGLISERLPGLFQRSKIRAEGGAVKQVAPANAISDSAPPALEEANSETPLDVLAAVASKLRATSKMLGEMSLIIEDAVLKFEDQSIEESEEVKRLRQLAALIKTL